MALTVAIFGCHLKNKGNKISQHLLPRERALLCAVALWKVGNYAKSGGRRKFAFSLRGSRVNAGEVLRASGSYARYGFILIASQKGLPSDDG